MSNDKIIIESKILAFYETYFKPLKKKRNRKVVSIVDRKHTDVGAYWSMSTRKIDWITNYRNVSCLCLYCTIPW